MKENEKRIEHEMNVSEFRHLRKILRSMDKNITGIKFCIAGWVIWATVITIMLIK
jgi:hypothetical protein